MPVTELDVHTSDGVMDVHLHTPPAGRADGGAPLPVAILYPDAAGVRPAAHEMAERLAAEGYAVALTNYYYRYGPFTFDITTAFVDPDERAQVMARMAQADPRLVVQDTAALLDLLATRDDLRTDKVGAYGYCRGGLMAFTLAGALPERVAAAASFHGGGIATEEPTSPHHRAGDIQAALYFGIAADDRTCTPEQQKLLIAALDAAGVRYELEHYDAPHGFAVPDHVGAYDEAAAARHWEKLTELFARELR
ncbi:dienelactone hydrolase family protein [Frankia sp. AgKG'84/4]|uniref:dienelactone hydrolase family protein n=1 Tax=Frankia sp. AgKG'84/4 TaxID=573490 RepID=UPI00200EC760|nr:dienelactone hydrolase family protein [Frankia sp. AgKG'84/4]MCL9795666.1 dienelactone hydrolase family protein [Frankia sp. AgKG'84/4]